MQSSSKWICNVIISMIVGSGLVICLLMPDHAEAFGDVCGSLSILLGGWMVAIFGGNVSKLYYRYKGGSSGSAIVEAPPEQPTEIITDNPPQNMQLKK